jgi:hypothetical protein
MICCNKELKSKKGKHPEKGDYVYFHCETCGHKGAGIDAKQAEAEYNKNRPAQMPPTEKSNPQNSQHIHNTQKSDYQISTIARIPRDLKELPKWYESNIVAMENQTLQIQDKPATRRMLQKNYNYLMRIIDDPKFKKVTATEEGMQSITDAYGNALEMAATLGDMGDIIPFGKVAEFIPAVECYKFCLETGKNAPFKDIDILPIYENDQITENEISNGDYKFKYKPGFPRGEIIGVVVLATRTDTGKIIGEAYDSKRLMEKAAQHSPAYKNFIIERENFQRLKVEGKLKNEGGREYYEKVVNYKDKDGKDKSFTDKVFYSDIVNPYEGPDRPEMLRKSAGKSFFRPYMKTRNASAMADEWGDDEEQTREQTADSVLSRAGQQFSGNNVSPIKDAEIIPEEKDLKKDSDNDLNGL